MNKGLKIFIYTFTATISFFLLYELLFGSPTLTPDMKFTRNVNFTTNPAIPPGTAASSQ